MNLKKIILPTAPEQSYEFVLFYSTAAWKGDISFSFISFGPWCMFLKTPVTWKTELRTFIGVASPSVRIVCSLFCTVTHPTEGLWMRVGTLYFKHGKYCRPSYQANSFLCFPHLLCCTQLMLQPLLCLRLTLASIKLGHTAFSSSWITHCFTRLSPGCA